MTEKRCTDCKYTKGIGYDFWCGEGHTEYEVFGAETNCPYYEYHDWSNGTPSRTENKRFRKVLGLIEDSDGSLLDLTEIEEMLNSLNDENEQLKKIIEDNVDFKNIFSDRDLNDICNEMGYELSEKEIKLQRLEKENEQLQKEVEDLKQALIRCAFDDK